MRDRLVPAAVLIVALLAGLAAAGAEAIGRRLAPLPIEPTYSEIDAQIQRLTMALVSRELSRTPQPIVISDGLYRPTLPDPDPGTEKLRQQVEATRTQRHLLATSPRF